MGGIVPRIVLLKDGSIFKREGFMGGPWVTVGHHLKESWRFQPLSLSHCCLAGEEDGFALPCVSSMMCHLTTG